MNIDETETWDKLKEFSSPFCKIDATSIKAIKAKDKGGTDLFKKRKVVTAPVKLFTPEVTAEYKIRLKHSLTSDNVTINDALKAIGEDYKIAEGEDPFEWDENNGKLKKAFGMSGESFADDDYVIFLQIGDKVHCGIPDDILSKDLTRSGFSIWVMDLSKPENYSDAPLEIKRMFFEKLKELAKDDRNGIHLYRLGWFCEHGFNVGECPDDARGNYTKSAEKGYTLAYRALGDSYAKEKKFTDAIENYQKAPKNDPDVRCAIGECNEELYNKEKEDHYASAAAAEYNEAAALKHAKAQYKLGKCYADGIGVNKDGFMAVKCYKDAIDHKEPYPPAQYELGIFYLNRQLGGLPYDETKAFELFLDAARQGHTPAQYELGNCYKRGIGTKKGIDNTKAVYWYRCAAEQGYPPAQYELGNCYKYGISVKEDVKAAFVCYQKAAKQGYPPAQYELGNCYKNGIGVKEDKKEAFEWYQKAAKQGYPPAQISSAECYQKGYGVSEDFDKAMDWYLKAKNDMNYIKKFSAFLKEITARGDKFYKNGKYEDAVIWYRKAAEKGYSNAQGKLAKCYKDNIGVGKLDEYERYKFAVHWYKKAKEGGNEDAKKMVDDLSDECLDKGNKLDGKDDKLAADWYQLSAELGDRKAQVRYGQCFMYEKGRPKDFNEARRWFTISKNNGGSSAQNALDELDELEKKERQE